MSATKFCTLWAAETTARNLAVPAATTGCTIACTQTPASWQRLTGYQVLQSSPQAMVKMAVEFILLLQNHRCTG